MRFTGLAAVLLFFFSILSCKENDMISEETLLKIQTELETSENGDIKALFEKYIPDKSMQLRFVDENLYYPFGLLYTKKHKLDPIGEYLFSQAIDGTNNLFRKEALYSYISLLIEEKRWDSIKDLITTNADLLDEDKEFLSGYEQGSTIDTLTYLPENRNYFPLLMEIIRQNPRPLKETEYARLLNSFCIKSYNSAYFKRNIDLLEEALKYSDSTILKSIYYYTGKEKEYFAALLGAALDECIYHYEADFIKSMAYKLGLRKAFYKALTVRAAEGPPFIQYLYGIEAIYYTGYSTGLAYLKKAQPYYEVPSSEDYMIRSKQLFYKISLSGTRIKEIITYCNDYPNTYMSKILLHYLVKRSILYNKQDYLIPYFKDVDTSRMDSLNKSIFLYWMTLLDKDPRWKEELQREHHFSYGNLSYNPAQIASYISTDQDNDKKPSKLSEEGEKNLKKISYLLQYHLYNEAKKISHENMPRYDKIKLYEQLENYLLARNRYYDALGMSKKINKLQYGDNFAGIDLAGLKKLFPTHFKKQILYYSEKYHVDPALAFAVMREESHFAKDITSWASAVGLMQIMPSTRDWLAPKVGIKNPDLTNPDHNIHMGVYFLNFLEEHYFHDKEYILASYNAGQGRMLRWEKQYRKYPKKEIFELLPLAEPRHYIRKVMRSYHIYKYLLSLEEN